MFTFYYLGYYIHGHCDKDECTVAGKKCKSLRSAKCWITRQINKQKESHGS